MISIYNNIVKIENLIIEVQKIYEKRYDLKQFEIKNSLSILKRTIDEFNEDIYVNVEHPYVDKTYRDSYYKYFASKRDTFSRDTIRLSFFNEQVEDKDFRELKKLENLEDSYLGFMVLRPTFPQIIGRTVLRKDCLKRTDYITSGVVYNTTVNSIKLKVIGFPHSSQDSETISCAETTVWGLLEYFGFKYPEYKPMLPSKINDVLGKYSTERLIPSNGLTAGQIAYALKEFGFGVKIYSRKSYGNEFEKIIRVYVESGIPIVGLIQNTNGIGHALNIIGRANITKDSINHLSMAKTIDNNVNVYEFEELDIDYCFVDDNYPPYQLTKLKDPASYYTNPKWKGCEITNIIVPLYPKIYLEAGEAKKIAFTVIEQLKLIKDKDIVVKTFLASSRSFKNAIALNEKLNEDAKELLLATSMPKFIWIMEISDKDLIINNLISGMVIMDATEPKRLGIIAALIENTYIANDMAIFNKISIPLQPFTAYNNNLN
ncbi:hypothetical protein [Algibacter pacificus]|uniref:hypothetical protein n=1 Tax=Algibacter pacificus TaxID=2599389 RepID=UPI0011C99BD4|nr:hypothetical protein [Algibacter pacificus]